MDTEVIIGGELETFVIVEVEEVMVNIMVELIKAEKIIWSVKKAFKKKSVTFFTLGGGGGVKIGLCYTFFFTKIWFKMA